jgi:CHAT domain-containing protein
MVSFYKHLKQGESKDGALASAQREVRQQYPNPYLLGRIRAYWRPGTGKNAKLNRYLKI